MSCGYLSQARGLTDVAASPRGDVEGRSLFPLAMIDKHPRQIEHASHPADNGDDMYRLDPHTHRADDRLQLAICDRVKRDEKGRLQGVFAGCETNASSNTGRYQRRHPHSGVSD
jgi:hypothetical protein